MRSIKWGCGTLDHSSKKLERWFKFSAGKTVNHDRVQSWSVVKKAKSCLGPNNELSCMHCTRSPLRRNAIYHVAGQRSRMKSLVPSVLILDNKPPPPPVATTLVDPGSPRTIYPYVATDFYISIRKINHCAEGKSRKQGGSDKHYGVYPFEPIIGQTQAILPATLKFTFRPTKISDKRRYIIKGLPSGTVAESCGYARFDDGSDQLLEERL
ncbi:hypothetical protein I7I51_07252 [Histoplasma capsulatum]|uniref:Uncharacterized protein n=1 Tax=Ajellomyces capsulatus TaxID=5037 RepID=A0A8A1MKK9_AJECA|nr:hypothetical protein I7I51_07252 [Histoplasma capsulatum]